MKVISLAAIWLVGCTGTVGPYVADIRELPDGRYEMTRCTTTVTQTGGFGDKYDNGNCTKKTIGHPVGASPAGAPGPTAAESAGSPTKSQGEDVVPR